MAAKRTGLGRGLDALLGDVQLATGPAGEGAEALQQIPVDLLRRGQYQPRRQMNQEALEELARSIEAQGLVQPIVVRPLPGAGPGQPQYEIVAGERRWRAAQLAGLAEVPAVVREIPDSAAIAVALIENIQREDLNPLEEAQAVRRLVDEFELTHQQAADAIGRSRTAVTNLLRLLELGPEAKALVEAGDLEMGHARALLALGDGRQQAEVAALVARKGLSVRETEQLVRRLLAGKPAPKPRGTDPDVRRLQEELSGRLGARVSIQHGRGGKGRLVISYTSLEELEGILDHIR
ncbi:MAG: ParB/RepB/Spo0J family partition protein [Gammaproteobacteria bacterium]|nr:MAG: ParB/RepB/Spo0J family partition protein [Gammaproteobacteria bacterium]